jgi:hypothetical protein
MIGLYLLDISTGKTLVGKTGLSILGILWRELHGMV